MTQIFRQKRMLISVVTYKGCSDTVKFLISLLPHLEESGCDTRIMIVDNYEQYSKADVQSVESELSHHFHSILFIDFREKKTELELKGINYVFTHRNLGYANGNNLAFQLGNNGFASDYFLVIGNDVFLISKDFFPSLTQKLDSIYDVAIIGPKITGPHSDQQGPYRYQSIRRRYIALFFYPILKILSPAFFLNDEICDIEEGYVYRLIGCFLLMKSSCFIAVDGFDDGTFLFAEEFIVSERFLKIEMNTYYYGRLHAYHDASLTIKKYHDQRSANRLRFESDIYYYKKYRYISHIEEFLARLAFRVYDRLYCSILSNKSAIRDE